MAEQDTKPIRPEGPASTSEAANPVVAPSPIDRADLLLRARSFLASPQVQHQNLTSKRQFLVEKGLNDQEIDTLLRELPPRALGIPPRTYPQPPASNLPNLLVGLAKLLSWLAGGSAALIYVYYRFLLPHLTASAQARASLKQHQLSLLRKLTTSISTLKETQVDAFSVLPAPQPYKEESKTATCHTIEELLRVFEKVEELPPISLLRCTIEELSRDSEPNTRTETIFELLATRIPWLNSSDEGVAFQHNLWQTLNACPLFQSQETELTTPPLPPSVSWSYNTPIMPPPTPLATSLDTLSIASRKPRVPTLLGSTQATLSTLTSFTGYLTTQMYSMPGANMYRPPGSTGHLSPTEEEMKKDIKALKGLVLNRRSFMPAR